MIEFRGGEVNTSAELAIEESTICRDSRRQKCFAVLPGDHEEHFTELSIALFIEDAEQNRDECLLPKFQLYQLRRECSFVMTAEVLDKSDGGIRLLRGIKKDPIFEAFDY